MIGRIRRVPLREVWKHEALDFTKWLLENTDVLNDVLDIQLTGAQHEQSAGDFSVDLVAEDAVGNPVVIENQLEKSNHDHLGKLLTYLTALGAKTAIWIVSHPRPEHVGAVTWLNESTEASFYMVKVEAICIGESSPAPLLTLIVGPSAEGREVGETKRELAERYVVRKRFWTSLIEAARKRTQLHSNLSAPSTNWIGTGAGKAGLTFNYVIRQHGADVELYIDRGLDKDAENHAILIKLEEAKGQIEAEFGKPLEWDWKEGRRSCRIRNNLDLGGWSDEEDWPKIQEAMVDSMIRLEKAIRPHIDALKI